MHARPYVSLEDLLQRKCLLRHGLLAIESFLGITSPFVVPLFIDLYLLPGE